MAFSLQPALESIGVIDMQNGALVMNPPNLPTKREFMGQVIEILSIQTWGMIKRYCVVD